MRREKREGERLTILATFLVALVEEVVEVVVVAAPLTITLPVREDEPVTDSEGRMTQDELVERDKLTIGMMGSNGCFFGRRLFVLLFHFSFSLLSSDTLL